jgi:hypothetical protein
MLTLENYPIKQLRLQYADEYYKQIVDLAVQYIYYDMYGLKEKSEKIYTCLLENVGIDFYIKNFSLLS